MARLPRLFAPGCPQQILHRSHNGIAIFAGDDDRQLYLDWLVEALRMHTIRLHAYALTSSQVQLLVSAGQAEDSSAAMASVARRYAQHFNRRRGRSGTIWEGRFRSSIATDDAHVLGCYRYTDTSPLRTGDTHDALAYPWSSCAHHVGRRTDPFLSDHPVYWALGNTPFERQAAYERLCEQPLGEMERRIHEATLKGWALGTPSAHAPAASRRPAPLPRGRPPRNAADAPPSSMVSPILKSDSAFSKK